LLAACSSAPPATPEQRLQAERRLLAPFLAPREVGCGELLVEVTPNFYTCVGQPSFDANRHLRKTERGDGYVDTVFTSKTGDADSAMVLTIGEGQQVNAEHKLVLGRQTQFRVVNQVRVRMWEARHEMMLNATAGGRFVFVSEAANETPREVAKFAIVDGVLHKQ
jgi:hypothetical protein